LTVIEQLAGSHSFSHIAAPRQPARRMPTTTPIHGGQAEFQTHSGSDLGWRRIALSGQLPRRDAERSALTRRADHRCMSFDAYNIMFE
jgi:hypothetical protein